MTGTLRILALVAALTLALPATPVRAAPNDFHSAWVDQSPFPTLAASATTSYTLRFRNTGTAAWRRGTPDQANLGIVGDATTFGALAVNWLSPNRVATTTESVVAPGAIATFTFTLRAPTANGSYRIPLQPVIDGLTWMEDNGVFVVLVSDSGFHSQWVTQTPYPSVRAGETTPPISITFRNTGTRAWSRPPTGPQLNLGVVGDEASPYAVGWLSPNRVATTTESSVPPGANGTFTFKLKAPAAAGTYTLRLRPVVDGVAWLEDQGVFVNLTVVGDPGAVPTLTDEVVQSGLAIPWEVAFTPDGRMFVTERSGRLRVYASGHPGASLLGTTTIAGIHASGESGLMGIALDPAFPNNGFVYLCASRDDEGQWRNQVLRYRMSGNVAAFDTYVIRRGMVANSNHDGCRIRFGPDGKLWVTMGEAGNGSYAQDPNSLNGKVLRVNSDGTVPADNPILPGASGRSAAYTMGHRNPQGIAFQPGTGAVFTVEHGPDCDDEINVLSAGANYGWPNVRGSDGPGGYADPVWQSGCPTIASSGAAFVTGASWGAWSGSLFVAQLKDSDLRRFAVQGTQVTAGEVLLNGKYGRLRAAVLAPDGTLYLTTSGGSNDKVIRVTAQP
jgi:glucose/arabinose dehydrogenase